MKHLFGNQQVTNALGKLVGTSEAIRPLTYSPTRTRNNTPNSKQDVSPHPDLLWNQWLAGLIDGHGCFLVSREGYTSCEITMDLRDEHALQQIKSKLGGSIKLRAGTLSIRYRLHHKSGMLNLLQRVNGEIRHSIRQKQFSTLCDIFHLTPQTPAPLLRENAWFAGFFDADGTITMSLKAQSGLRFAPQCIVSVSNKKREDLQSFQEVFGGNIYYEKSSRTYKWSIQRKESVLDFLTYTKTIGGCRSSKKFRFFLLSRYYELVDLRAYRAEEGSLLCRAWEKFLEKWKSRSE